MHDEELFLSKNSHTYFIVETTKQISIKFIITNLH
jgi:hypothetical protein